MQASDRTTTVAIDWGYRRIPNAASPDAERPVLDSLARSQDAQPWDRWIGDGDRSIRASSTEAAGDDPVEGQRATASATSSASCRC